MTSRRGRSELQGARVVEVGELTDETLAGRFRVEECIGRGGYGAVFRATQLSVDRECAVKVLAPRLVSDESVVERFRVEAKTTSSLSHPHTVVLYDFGRDEERSMLFLAMELLEGESLRETVEREGPLPVDEVARIATQVAGSLQEAHDAGTVHRDVKPGNVMLVERGDEDRFVKVIDFGIAKAVREDHDFEKSLTGQGMMVGTPAYMSPEQVRSKSIGGSTDQYALAMTIYFAVAGRTPFHGGTSMEIASRHLTKEPTPLSEFRPGLGLSDAVDDVLLNALSKTPADRYDTVEEFAAQFCDAVEVSSRGLDSAAAGEGGGGAAGREVDEMATTAVDDGSPGSQTDEQDGATVAVSPGRWSGSSEGEPERRAHPTHPEEDDDRGGLSVRRILAVAAVVSAFLFAVVVWAVLIGEVGLRSSESGASVGADAGEPDSDRSPVAGTARGSPKEMPDASPVIIERAGGHTDTSDTGTDVGFDAEGLGATAVGGSGPPDRDERSSSDESAGARPAGSSTIVVRMIPWGTLYVDGEEVGRGSRVQARVVPGRHEISMYQNGVSVADRILRVKAGQRRQIELAAP